LKVVLDTSVLIAAFYPALDRPCFSRDVFDFVSRKAECVISDYIHDEFRKKCADKLEMSQERIAGLWKLIRSRVRIVPTPPEIVAPKQLRDQDDLPILGLAMAVDADYLITWDKHLLTLGQFRRTVICSPRSFWDSAR
jgi:putative PIN family toxin of toxin-antitoxin system